MKALQHPISAAYTHKISQKSVWTRFITWCSSQESARLVWLAVIIAGHGCFITPLTVMFVMLAGNSPVGWAFAIAAMTMSLVSNLAAMPTRVTIPVFFLSLLIDLVLIINAIILMQ